MNKNLQFHARKVRKVVNVIYQMIFKVEKLIFLVAVIYNWWFTNGAPCIWHNCSSVDKLCKMAKITNVILWKDFIFCIFKPSYKFQIINSRNRVVLLQCWLLQKLQYLSFAWIILNSKNVFTKLQMNGIFKMLAMNMEGQNQRSNDSNQYRSNTFSLGQS